MSSPWVSTDNEVWYVVAHNHCWVITVLYVSPYAYLHTVKLLFQHNGNDVVTGRIYNIFENIRILKNWKNSDITGFLFPTLCILYTFEKKCNVFYLPFWKNLNFRFWAWLSIFDFQRIKILRLTFHTFCFDQRFLLEENK